ncbi:YybS family protein [Salisediminibacterium beveridgei]|nr:YybS family protein [Salisediminibacterium beveridgei]
MTPIWKDTIKALLTYLVLLSSVLFFPFIGIILAVFVPVPLAWLTYRHDWRQGTITALISSLLLSFIFGPFSLIFTILFALPGVLMGHFFKQKRSAFSVLAGVGLSITAGVVLLYAGTNIFLNIDPVQSFQTAMYESVETSENMIDVMDPQNGMLVEEMKSSIDYISVIAPFILVMISVSYSFLVQLTSGHILRKGGHEIVRFPPFRTWGFPKEFIWYYLVILMLSFVTFESGSAVFIAVENLLPLLHIIMTIQGLAFIFFYFNYKGRSITWPVIIVILAVLLPIFLQLIRILGIIDLGFNLRERMQGSD